MKRLLIVFILLGFVFHTEARGLHRKQHHPRKGYLTTLEAQKPFIRKK